MRRRPLLRGALMVHPCQPTLTVTTPTGRKPAPAVRSTARLQAHTQVGFCGIYALTAGWVLHYRRHHNSNKCNTAAADQDADHQGDAHCQMAPPRN